VHEILNGIFYVLWTGCQWQALPKDRPPKSTVWAYFDLWTGIAPWGAGLRHTVATSAISRSATSLNFGSPACEGQPHSHSSAQNSNATPSKPTAAAAGTSATAETVGRPRRVHRLGSLRAPRQIRPRVAVKVPIEQQFQFGRFAKRRSSLRTSAVRN
jgi:putative transposase of IS4/5 family DUF4096